MPRTNTTHAKPSPRILGIATAVPPHRIAQDVAAASAEAIFAGRMREFARLKGVFDSAGIEGRWSAAPLDWFREPHGWRDRNALYLAAATDCLEQASRSVLDRCGLEPADVQAVVAISTSGVATPSLDALMIDRLGLRADVTRLPIFGLGCAGGVVGLGRAADLAGARPGALVLVLVVELCTIWFRDAPTKADLVATALFGDGAAALLLRVPQQDEDARGLAAPALRAWGEHTWPGTLDVMGWDVLDDGMGVIFSQAIPKLARERLRPAADAFLDRHGWSLADIDGITAHPGGAKVLDALHEVYAPRTVGLDDAAAILRSHGNMSAATVLFVLERQLRLGRHGRHLMTALGPGFTAGFAVVDL